MDNQQQLAFGFDKEIPSLVEPLQQKEKELGVSSPDLIPPKIQLINFYVENGKYNNAHKWLTKVIEQIHFLKHDDLPSQHCLEKLSGLAAVFDQHIPGAGMADRLDATLLLKTINQKTRKLDRQEIKYTVEEQMVSVQMVEA